MHPARNPLPSHGDLAADLASSVAVSRCPAAFARTRRAVGAALGAAEQPDVVESADRAGSRRALGA